MRRLKFAGQGFDGHTLNIELLPRCRTVLSLNAVTTNAPNMCSRKGYAPQVLSQVFGRKANGRRNFGGAMATRNRQMPEKEKPALIPL